MLELVGILICWAVALFTFSVLGAVVLQALKVGRNANDQLFQYLVQVLCGIAFFNVLMGTASLMMPVTANLTIAIVAVCLAGLSVPQIRGRAALSINGISSLAWYSKLLLLLLSAAVLWVAGLPSLNYDTGLYHDQFIMWMNQYAAVPGLANLHERFGFNSHWQLVAASFNGYPYVNSGFNDMGALLTVVFLAASVESFQALITNANRTFLHGLMALSLVPLYLLARFFTSDTPDLPNSLIGFTVLAIPFYHGWKNDQRLLVLAVVGGLMVSIKVSSVLLLGVALPSLIGINWKKFGLALLVGLFVLMPWLARNYTFSGYLVYPAKFTAIGSPDFQAPVESLEYVNALLESHGKFGRYDVEMVGRPVSEWGHLWLGHQTTIIKLMLVFCFGLLLIFIPFDAFRAIRSKFEYRETLDTLIHLVFLLSMAIVFKLAPEIRYAYGVLLFYFVYLMLRVGLHRFRWPMVAIALGGVLMFARIVMVVSHESPAPVLSKTYATMDGSALPIYYPTEFDQCWDHQLPCTNRYIEGLEMRTDKLEDGFRIAK